MSNQPLFIESDVTFEKLGGEVVLPDDPNEWTGELMQELYKQVPYVSDFEPHVVMDRVDAERGFGFGHIEITNQTEIQHGADAVSTAAAGIRSARIPVVIKDRKLQPLDLLVTSDSKILPLTEQRLRSTLFRPQAFDITGRGPGDISMIGQLYPPYRQNYGFGGGGATMNVGMGKEGSVLDKKAAAGVWAQYDSMKKTGSVLAAVLPTITKRDYEAFITKVGNDRGLQAQYVANGAAAMPSLKMLVEHEPTDIRKFAGAVLEHVKPSVAQLRKESEGYSLKTANHQFWLPEDRVLNRGEAVALFGPKVVLAADQTGAVTMALGAEGETPADELNNEAPDLISDFGLYKVQDESGRDLVGYVFPNLIDIDGTVLPISLFTNGSQMAVQGEIVGMRAGEGAELFEGPPRGTGAFYSVHDNGHAQATIPMTIKASVAAPEEGGVVLHAETYDGRPVEVVVVQHLEHITASPEEGRMMVPAWFSWMPLDKAEKTALVSTPESFHKEARAARALTAVIVRSDGESFSFSGPPVEKLAAEERAFLSLDDAMFLLGGLGSDLDYVQQKLGEAAAFHRPVQVQVGTSIELAGSAMQASYARAEEKLASYPDLRQDLLKEAAVIPDPVAVDTVLSLGFLNSENLGMFISYLPVIDTAQQKLCELLLAARLGLREIPVGALERGVRSVEETLEGLKVLAFQAN